MTSTKEKMQQAKELIQAKKYVEARAILRTVDHDKAYEWLDKIDAILGKEKPIAVEEKPKVIVQTQDEDDNDSHYANLVCPKCVAQNRYKIDSMQMVSDGRQTLQCPGCSTEFTARLVFIRSKRSRKRDTLRAFDVRVMVGGSEELIQFITYDTTDMELRSKDLVAFLYLGDKLAIVQNLTIGLYWKIKDSACYLATYVYGMDSSEAQLLRRFRDEKLLPHLRLLVEMYYTISPRLISVFGHNPIFKKLVTIALTPVVAVIYSRYSDE